MADVDVVADATLSVVNFMLAVSGCVSSVPLPDTTMSAIVFRAANNLSGWKILAGVSRLNSSIL